MIFSLLCAHHAKIRNQFFYRNEAVTALNCTDMFVIAFIEFVIVGNDAFAMPAVKQAVFEAMRTLGSGLRQLPDRHFNNRTIRQDGFVVKQPLSFHRVYLAIILLWRQ
jgi:hypothetical protein